MNRVLNKRIFRDLKSNFLRYLALFLMIVMGMYIIIAVVGAAETIITRTVETGEKNHVEDGQFAVFTQLTAAQEKDITDRGVTLERIFSFDAQMSDNSVLRVFKVREKVDIIDADEGNIPTKTGEIFLEKRYCEEHKISLGDTLKIGEKVFVVTGIGTAPDYDAPTKKFSDSSVDSSLFGVGFVVPEDYEAVKSLGKTEDLRYAYLLNGEITHDDLKEIIKGYEFDYNDIEDEYFREMLDDTLGRKEDIQEGINELYDGSKELADGLSELDENSVEVTDSADEIFSQYLAQANLSLLAMGATDTLTAENYSEILDKYIAATNSPELSALKETLDGLKAYSDGVSEYTNGGHEAADGAAELADGVKELKTETDDMLDELFTVDIDNLTEFVEAADNPRIAAAEADMQMNKSVGLFAGVIIMVLFTYVISVFVIHQIQRESSVIGALYALGAKKKDLMGHYIALPTIISFAGGLAGSALGFSKFGIDYQMADTYYYFSVPIFEPVYPLYLIIYAVVMPPVISAIVNYLVINKRLSRTALSLIKNEQKTDFRTGVDLKKMGFLRRFQIRQMLREARTGLTVILGMLISLMIFMLGINCYVLCTNIKADTVRDTKFEYMYVLKYPEETPPENAEAYYVESLSKTAFDYTLDISVIGVDENEKYYGVSPEKGKSKITASRSAAQKYGLKKGDKLILTDSATDMDYAFTITDIADYSAGLSVFMDIDSMRELFGQEDDYYNMLLSDTALDIDEGRLYSVTSRRDIERSSAVFADLMMPMVIMMTVVSIIIFCVVMYLMLNVMIERASFGISLVKIFGYRTNEVRKLYLNGNTAVVAVGALIAIPVSKLFMDTIYPYMISNIACGMNLHFEWYMYSMIYVGIMLIYFAVNGMLTAELKKITPAEVLKNRE
ncbi:MAG: ABC transporter permease [Ruminococcus sp.]|nr:ABC transporter permease [Ruminococcus sp.]